MNTKERKDKKLYRRMGLLLTNTQQMHIAIGLFILGILLDFLAVMLISSSSSIIMGAIFGFSTFVVFSALLAYGYKLYRSRRD
jgi:hypothetical protein